MTGSSVTEIQKRKGVWTALSEFYLDTELQATDFQRIAAVFEQSGFTIEEIKLIDLYEVFPLLQTNLLSVAGEWAGFNENWLYEGCEKNYHKRSGWTHRIRCRISNKYYYWMRKSYWEAVEKLMCARGGETKRTIQKQPYRPLQCRKALLWQNKNRVATFFRSKSVAGTVAKLWKIFVHKRWLRVI